MTTWVAPSSTGDLLRWGALNNAGYGDVAPFEQLSSERLKAVIDTNFCGVVNVTRAALPIMRKQRSGCILQISSVGGRLAIAGRR